MKVISLLLLAGIWTPASSIADHLGLERLSDERAKAILEAATETQSALDVIHAQFAVSVELDGPALQARLPDWATLALARFGLEPVSGIIEWSRDKNAGKERVALSFALPRNKAVDVFTERTLVDDGVRQVEVFPPTSQALITESRALATWPVPADFLYPSARRSFRELIAEGTEIEVYAMNEEQYLVRFRPRVEDQGYLVEATLSEALEYAVTSWTCPGCGISAEIEYTSDELRGVLPARAKFNRMADGSSKPIMTWNVTVLRLEMSVPSDAFDVPFKAGMLVTDYTRGKSHTEPAALRVGPSGELVPLRTETRLSKASVGKQIYVTVAAALIALAFVAFRLRYAST